MRKQGRLTMKKLIFFRHFFTLLMQTELFQCHREERRRFPRLSLRAPQGRSNLIRKRLRLPRFARNDGLPRPFRARNDIVKIYIAFILVFGFFTIALHPAEEIKKETLMIRDSLSLLRLSRISGESPIFTLRTRRTSFLPRDST